VSKYHDDTTTASNPGGFHLSLDKLRLLQPELLTDVTLLCGSGCAKLHPAEELRDRIDEHLSLGDSRAAIVVSLKPLLIAAFSDDLDTVALLKFPEELARKYSLTLDSRLLTVNTYGKSQDRGTGGLLVAADLVAGPRHTNQWSNVQPYIAEFLSDDMERIEARKARIDEEEWGDARRLAAVRVRFFGIETARNGAPTHCASPVPITRGQTWKRLWPPPAPVVPKPARQA
jgi:hypothetical protein